MLEFATSAEHPLGCEFPNWLPPIAYEPETVAKAWRLYDARLADLQAAESTAREIEQWG